MSQNAPTKRFRVIASGVDKAPDGLARSGSDAAAEHVGEIRPDEVVLEVPAVADPEGAA